MTTTVLHLTTQAYGDDQCWEEKPLDNLGHEGTPHVPQPTWWHALACNRRALGAPRGHPTRRPRPAARPWPLLYVQPRHTAFSSPRAPPAPLPLPFPRWNRANSPPPRR